jgi:uncharacterized membrane protein YbhN (UPF0104 family)
LAAVAAVTLLAGAVPLQTFGGVGIVEIALTGSLVIVGIGVAAGTTVALLTRFLLITVPVVLWLPTLLMSASSEEQS